MTDEQIKEKRKELLSDTIIEIISEQSCKPKNIITTDTDIINDLSCDSLDAVEILMSLEEEFGKVIPEDDAENIGGKVSAIIDYIDKKLTDDEVISWYKRIQGHKLLKEEEKQDG